MFVRIDEAERIFPGLAEAAPMLRMVSADGAATVPTAEIARVLSMKPHEAAAAVRLDAIRRAESGTGRAA